MAEYFGCGFARVAVRQSFLTLNGKIEYDQELRWKRYLSQFQGPHSDRFAAAQKKYCHKRSKRSFLFTLRGGKQRIKAGTLSTMANGTGKIFPSSRKNSMNE